MTTTIPMFAQNISKYKMIRKQSRYLGLETMMGQKTPDASGCRIRFDLDTSMDIQRDGPLYQTGFPATVGTGQTQTADSYHYNPDLLRRNKSVPSKDLEIDLNASPKPTRTLMKQRLDDYFNGPAPVGRKTVNHFRLNKSTSSDKGFKPDGSLKSLNTSTPNGKAALYATLNMSPKWSQIKEKNTRYPHIC